MAKQSQLTLTWNSHNSLIKESLQNLHQKEIFCDATLVCHGKYFPAHKFILSTYSSYFEEVLEMTPCRHPFIIIKDVPEDELKALLEFMYNGVVNVYEDQITPLLKVAETFKIKGLSFPEEYSTCTVNSNTEELRGTAQRTPLAKIRRTKLKGRKRKASAGARNRRTGKKRLKNDSTEDKNAVLSELPISSTSDKTNEEQQQDFSEHDQNFIGLTDTSPNSFSFPQIIEDANNEVKSFECEGVDIKIENEVMEEEDIYCHISEPFCTTESPLNESQMNDYQAPNMVENEFANRTEEEDVMFAHLLEAEGELIVGEESDHSFDETLNEVSDPDWNRKSKRTTRCSICSYQPKSRIDLQNHKKTHTEKKPYKCSMCPYSTAHNYNLKVHFRIHTGEKPFKCSICSYSTIQRSNLDKHLRVHTGERPFKCPFCSYSGAQKSSLNKHMESHSEFQQQQHEQQQQQQQQHEQQQHQVQQQQHQQHQQQQHQQQQHQQQHQQQQQQQQHQQLQQE